MPNEYDPSFDIECALAMLKCDAYLDDADRRQLAAVLRRVAIEEEARAGLVKFRRPRTVENSVQ